MHDARADDLDLLDIVHADASRSAVVAAPRPTVTSASLPSVAPLRVRFDDVFADRQEREAIMAVGIGLDGSSESGFRIATVTSMSPAALVARGDLADQRAIAARGVGHLQRHALPASAPIAMSDRGSQQCIFFIHPPGQCV